MKSRVEKFRRGGKRRTHERGAWFEEGRWGSRRGGAEIKNQS